MVVSVGSFFKLNLEVSDERATGLPDAMMFNIVLWLACGVWLTLGIATCDTISQAKPVSNQVS